MRHPRPALTPFPHEAPVEDPVLTAFLDLRLEGSERVEVAVDAGAVGSHVLQALGGAGTRGLPGDGQHADR